LELNPQEKPASLLLHKVFEELKDKDAEYAHLKRATQNAEHDAELLLKLIGLARKRFAWSDMLGFAERLIQVRPFAGTTWHGLALAQLHTGKISDALSNARFGLQIAENSERAPLQIVEARALAAMGKKDEARTILEGLGENKEAKRALDEL
jgi:tetratricopeptide (TPR) repeat protein